MIKNTGFFFKSMFFRFFGYTVSTNFLNNNVQSSVGVSKLISDYI